MVNLAFSLAVPNILGNLYILKFLRILNPHFSITRQYQKIMSDQQLFSFGLITDVQYADVDDGYNFQRTSRRFYRKALTCLSGAIAQWNISETNFAIQLGDMIDGHSIRKGKKNFDVCKLHEEFDKYRGKFIANCCGNHDLYNFTRNEFMNSFLFPKYKLEDENTKIYEVYQMYTSKNLLDSKLCAYHFSPFAGFRFIVVDSYDISLLGREQSDPNYKQAEEILNINNDNEDKNEPPAVLKYVKYNGGISQEQLEWLDHILNHCDKNNEKAIICGHISLLPESSSDYCVLWNNEDVLSVMGKHSSVVAYFSGHDHDSPGYYKDNNGVHHRSFPSVIQSLPSEHGGTHTAFATIEVYHDRMKVNGVGDISSAIYEF